MSASLPLTSNRRFSISHGRAFWAMAAIAVTFPAASAVPSPLYSVYQEEWGFSSSTLTEVFGIYAVALLASLLVVGALSDHVGRRPVLFVAIAAEALSLVLFLVAGGVYMLALARIVQGLATGAALSTLSATLIDLQPEHALDDRDVVDRYWAASTGSLRWPGWPWAHSAVVCWSSSPPPRPASCL